jgi:hypothetical protein
MLQLFSGGTVFHALTRDKKSYTALNIPFLKVATRRVQIFGCEFVNRYHCKIRTSKAKIY